MASKKLTQNEVQTEPGIPTFIVGLDLGYGVVKAVCGDKRVSFPSVMGLAIPLTFQATEILNAHPGELVSDPLTDEEWFVGSLATSELKRSMQIQLQGRDKNASANMQFRLRLLYTALAKLLPHQNGKHIKVILSTGLPVDHMADGPALKMALIGQHVIHTNSCDMVVEIEIAYVMPQPKGTVYAFMYNPDGTLNDEQTYVEVVVHDVGRGTIDITLDRNGMFVRDQSGSIEGGVFTVQERLEDMFEAEYGEKPSFEMIEEILIHKVAKISGVLVDFSKWVEEAAKPMVTASLSLMGRTIRKGLEIEIIYLVGGGAELVYKDTVTVYPQTVLAPDAQWTNALGYERYAKFKARQ